MLSGLFTMNGTVGKDIELGSSMKELRQKSMSAISKAYEQELFERGYFAEKPSDTRMRWVGKLFLLTLPFALAVGLVSWWATASRGAGGCVRAATAAARPTPSIS